MRHLVAQWPKDSRNLWIAAVIVVAPFALMLPITHDSAWTMWIGRKTLTGANLYSDIIEVNPPLWFWIGTPVAGLADTLGLRSLSVLVVFFLIASAGSLALMLRLGASGKMLAAAFLAMLLLPIEHFTQREHFTLISTAPYVLLIARRNEGAFVGDKLPWVIGIYAAIGLALKPHFVFVPIALELWLWHRKRIRPETLALLIVFVLYAVSLLLLERDYFTVTMPLALQAYAGFAPMKLASLFPLTLFVFALTLKPRVEAAAFLVAALAFLLAFLSQAKGFGYQSVPALGMLLIASFMCGRIGVLLSLMILVANVRPYHTPPWMDLQLAEGTSFAALSVHPRAGWPMAEEQRLEWKLPYLSLWMAPKMIPDIESGLLADPPEVLLVDDRTVDFSKSVPRLLEKYQLKREAGGLKLYVLLDTQRNGANLTQSLLLR